ncbi:MAG: hypothetical protein ABR521_02670 [Gaiellaceae bacterium]
MILAGIFEREQVLLRTTLEGDGTLTGVYYGVVIVLLATFVIGYPLVESAAAEIVRQSREEGPRSLRLVASRTLRAGPLAVVCALLGLAAVAGGLLLLIAPGLVLLAPASSRRSSRSSGADSAPFAGPGTSFETPPGPRSRSPP